MRADHEQRPDNGRRWYRKLDLTHRGKTFLRRRGIDVRLFGVLLHRIDAPDPGLDLHDHPWAFVSLVIRGGYTEQWAETGVLNHGPHTHTPGRAPRTQTRTWRRWTIHPMPLTVAHRITAVESNTITIVLRGPKVRRWGFYLPDGWVDWEHYDYAARRPGGAVSNRPGESHDDPGARAAG